MWDNMNNQALIYCPLALSLLVLFAGAIVYYVHRYGGIPDNSFYNKHKPSKNNFLIRLKLFKYDNNFNYFLLIPYLIAWNLFFVIVILYIIYWCGVMELKNVFMCKWVNFSLLGIGLLYMLYSAFIDMTK